MWHQIVRPSSMACRLVLLPVSFLFSALLSLQTVAQQLPGGEIVGSEAYGRPWNYVDNNEPEAFVRGVLTKIKFNTGAIATHDWDLCVFVQPDPDYEKYATNCLGNVNPSIDGLGRGTIEYEVKTLEWTLEDKPDKNFRDFFRNTFHVGSSIDAYGYWVQDWGHEPWDPKTELHPIIYLKQQYSDGLGIFVPRDVSERFYVSPPSLQEFKLDIAAELDELELAGVSQITSTAPASVVFERSMLDISTGTRSGFSRSLAGYPYEPFYRVSISLGEPDLKEAAEPGGHYHPFYLGQMRAGKYLAFSDALVMSVKRCEETGLDQAACPAGKKVLLITLRAALKPVTGPWDTGPHSWAWANWRLSKEDPLSASGEIPFDEVVQSGTEVDTVEFTRYYSPQLGWSDNRWLLSVKAVRNSDAYVSRPPKAGEGPGVEAFLYKERIYSVATSRMYIVNEDAPAQNLATRDRLQEGGFSYDVKCTPSTQKFLATMQAMAGVSPVPNTFHWEVRPLRDSSGNPPPAGQAGWQTVSQATGSWMWDGLKAEVDVVDTRRLLVTATHIPASQLWSKAVLEIRASEETDIGEDISASRCVRWNQCTLSGGPEDFLVSVYKGVLAIEYLRRRGLLPDPIPEDFARVLGRHTRVPWLPNQQAALPEPYELLPRLTGRPRIAMKAYYELMAGAPVNRNQLQTLVRFASEGAKVKWDTTPPSRALNMLRDLTVRRFR